MALLTKLGVLTDLPGHKVYSVGSESGFCGSVSEDVCIFDLSVCFLFSN